MSNWKIENGPVTPAPIRRTRDGLAWNSYPSERGMHHQVGCDIECGYTYDDTDVPALVRAAEDIRDYAQKRWAAAEAENAERRTAAIAATADQEQRDALWKRMGSEQHKIANEIAKALEDRDA